MTMANLLALFTKSAIGPLLWCMMLAISWREDILNESVPPFLQFLHRGALNALFVHRHTVPLPSAP